MHLIGLRYDGLRSEQRGLLGSDGIAPTGWSPMNMHGQYYDPCTKTIVAMKYRTIWVNVKAVEQCHPLGGVGLADRMGSGENELVTQPVFPVQCPTGDKVGVGGACRISIFSRFIAAIIPSSSILGASCGGWDC